MRPVTHHRARGQMLVLFALSASVMLLVSGFVIDGGYALAQQRSAQNTSDLAALAGARVLASYVSGNTTSGTDSNVRLSIDQTLAVNDAPPVTYGAPNGPRYVDMNGNLLAYVGTGIPAGAVGVRVGTTRTWTPFFLGIMGVDNWSAGAVATARGGYRVGGPPAGNLLPIGISKKTYETFTSCPAGKPKADCTVVDLNEGTLNIPGGFGWLKFGCGGDKDKNGNIFGLGQNGLGCGNDKPFLLDEWGNLSANPPVMPNGYGCCTEVGLPNSGDLIGSLPGDKASVENGDPGVAYYITTGAIGFVPIWDYADANGSLGYYHIVGYAGFELTSVKGAKEIQGILRQVIFPGPTTETSPGFAGAPLAVQLIK